MNDMDVVDIVVLIDKSISMGGMEKETIGAFNAFLKEQKEVEGEALLTLVLFDHDEEVLYFREPLANIKNLTKKTYKVRGNTAMYDCIGGVIAAMTYASKSDRVIFLIQSDGQENVSQHFSGSRIKRMIAEKEKRGWDFKFIGTGIDAIQEGHKFGLTQDSCFSFEKNIRGFMDYGNTISTCSTSYRTNNLETI